MSTNNFNFDRCLKLVFTDGNIGKGNEFVIEYNPRKAPFLCPRLEVEIIDTPASKLNGKAGYEAHIKIYNPSPDILSMVASGMSYFTNGSDVQRYYQGKLRVSIYAGYFVPKQQEDIEAQKATEKKKEAETKAKTGEKIILKDSGLLGDDRATYGGEPIISTAYVNNSSYEHKGADNILTLSCHNIDITAMQYKQMKPVGNTKRFVPVFSWDVKKDEPQKGYPTFDQTFKYFATKYADVWYPYGKRGVVGSTMPEALPTNSAERGTTNPQWMKVLYVSKLSDFLSVSQKGGGWEDVQQDEVLLRRATDANLENRIRTDKFYTNCSTKDTCLNELCAFGGERLDFRYYTDRWGYIVYVVFPLGSYQTRVPLTGDGVVKIINFQNLLDTPMASPAGSLNVKMWFNRECKPWRYLALVLDSEYDGNQEETGVLNINRLNFTNNPYTKNQIIVPLGGTGSNAAVSTTQLSTSMAVSAAAHYQKVAAENGYMFNTGFLITKVTHKLTTHGKDWTTTVQTAPMMTGAK